MVMPEAVPQRLTRRAQWAVAAAGQRLGRAAGALLRLGFLLLFCQEKSKRKNPSSAILSNKE